MSKDQLARDRNGKELKRGDLVRHATDGWRGNVLASFPGRVSVMPIASPSPLPSGTVTISTLPNWDPRDFVLQYDGTE